MKVALLPGQIWQMLLTDPDTIINNPYDGPVCFGKIVSGRLVFKILSLFRRHTRPEDPVPGADRRPGHERQAKQHEEGDAAAVRQAPTEVGKVPKKKEQPFGCSS